MKAFAFLLPLLLCVSGAIVEYEVVLANYITTYYSNYKGINKLPKIDFYFNGVKVSSAGGLGYTAKETVTVSVNDSAPDPIWTVKATDADLYQPWNADILSQVSTPFTGASTKYNLWVSRSVDIADTVKTPTYNYVFFPEYNGDGTACAGITGVDTSTTVLVINLGTGQGANQGFGNVNFATDGLNQNIGAGSLQYQSIRIYGKEDRKTTLRIKAAGKTWVDTQFRPECGGKYMWVAYGDRQHQDEWPVHLVGPYSSTASSLAVSIPAILLGLLVAFFSA